MAIKTDGAADTQPARITRLQRELAQRLAQDIAAGVFELDSHLSEKALSERYEVSRTPVRGALRLLAESGLARCKPNSGYYVARRARGDDAVATPEGAPMTSEDLYRRLVADRSRRLIEDSFTDSELLHRYGVPRSILMKTLLRMASEGVLEKRQGHGWRFPASLADDDVRKESYRFRMMIECAGLREPGFNVDARAFRDMRERHEALLADSRRPIATGDFFALNSAFHEMLARCSGNRFILQAVQQQNQLRQLDAHPASYPVSTLERYVREHLDILDAMEAGDQEWAAAVMQRHLKATQWAA
ncbi:GntR family transcriptional regulator [Achromobacter aloeverae]